MDVKKKKKNNEIITLRIQKEKKFGHCNQMWLEKRMLGDEIIKNIFLNIYIKCHFAEDERCKIFRELFLREFQWIEIFELVNFFLSWEKVWRKLMFWSSVSTPKTAVFSLCCIFIIVIIVFFFRCLTVIKHVHTCFMYTIYVLHYS